MKGVVYIAFDLSLQMSAMDLTGIHGTKLLRGLVRV
jgi:hypothetical protein